MTTMISEPPASKTRLGVGLDPNRRPVADPQAWKRNIGTKPIPARLALLPDGGLKWRAALAARIGALVALSCWKKLA